MASALATTIGATAVATVLAAPADAVPAYHVWDRVANCESSNNWHINTGNGFYGGLQFSASTWSAYGGHVYANMANQASRLEQIEVARRVLASQGPGAWPVCGPRAGLNRTNGFATSSRVTLGSRRVTHTAVRHRTVHHSVRHGRTYVVRSGDTLSKIAARYHVRGGWHALYRANRTHLHNPNVLRVGQHLTLP